MAADFIIKQHATLPILEAILSRADGPIPLDDNDIVVKLVLRPRADPENVEDTLVLDAAVDDDGVDPELKGAVHCAFSSDDTEEAGDFLANWHIQYSPTDVEVIPTYGAFTVSIEPAPDVFAIP